MKIVEFCLHYALNVVTISMQNQKGTIMFTAHNVITKVIGSFKRGELVKCVDKNDCEVARGLVNYDSSETRLIAGAASSEIVNILGYQENDTIIDKDNLIAID